ncbi:TetR family transcriptional regulator [Nocardia brasiliensis]|uniref:TetR family transcriptional regulator n=1 Tax=Nocardia brasiliensis TaxID=37326 RepID=A0A6G9XYS7_NOCBR|nr:TetR/AcrR family transcriptional regulator [Nocardia brasiliensis]QIS05973.1 TetR family transcriptional regulator [Nocardia brasiliensis]
MSSSSSAETKRVRLSPDERRVQLITLGAEMLAERALEDISVDDIAKQAGISRGLLFHYFASKNEFHEAIALHVNSEFLTAIAPDRSLGLFDMLRDAVERYVAYVEENQAAYHAVLRGPFSYKPGTLTLVNESRSAIAEIVLAETPIPLDDPDRPRLALAVRGWIAFVEETILTWISDKPVSREQLIELIVESLPALALSPELTAALRPSQPTP